MAATGVSLLGLGAAPFMAPLLLLTLLVSPAPYPMMNLLTAVAALGGL